MTLRFLLLLSLLLSLANTVCAQEGQNPYFTEWADVMPRYGQDPVAVKEEVIALGRKGTQDLLVDGLIILGDAYLREGDYARAARTFERAVIHPGASTDVMKATLGHYAQLGLGMAKVGTGQLDQARAAFTEAATAGGDLGQMAKLADAQTTAAMGDYDEAIDLFDELASTEGVEPSVGAAAEFAKASTLLTAGNYTQAMEAFDALAEKDGPFRDDALYAKALARISGGEGTEGREILERIAQSCPSEAGTKNEGEPKKEKASRGMRQLAPRAVLLNWIQSYRESSFDAYTTGSTDFFDLDGCVLAVETLERWSSEPVAVTPPAPLARQVAIDEIETALPAASGAPTEKPTAQATAPTADSSESDASWVTMLVLVAGAVVGIGALVRLMRR